MEDKLYKKLTSDEKIKYILDKQNDGISLKEISTLMGYSNIKNIKDFMKNKGFIIENGVFIKNVECGNSHIDNTSIEIIGGKSHALVLQDKNIQEKLFSMIDKYDKFTEVLNWYEEHRGQVGGNSHTVEVVMGLQIDYEETKTMKTSIRIDEGVWEMFKELGDSKYKHISNTKLISQAVYEFVEKYK